MDLDIQRRRRYEHLVAQVYDPLQRYFARRVAVADASDLLSETLLVLWRRLDDVPEDRALPWSYGVARHVVANHRRAMARRARLREKLEVEHRDLTAPDPADSGDPVLAEALATLSSDDQELLRLWAWERLEPREMAQVLGTGANAISLRLGRAKKRLARAMVRQDGQPAGHVGDRHTEEQRP